VSVSLKMCLKPRHRIRTYCIPPCKLSLDEAGSDISGMSDDELMDQSEVFAIADGRFLVVEG